MIALVAMSWGSSYLLMKIGLDGIPSCSIIALQFGIAFLAVGLIFIPWLRRTKRKTLMYGSLLGLMLFGVFVFLMYGLKTTSAASAGFLTSTTVTFVPIFHACITRRLPGGSLILGTLLTLSGICLLTLRESFSIHSGDLLCISGAALYACHIILTDHLTAQEDGLLLGVWQLGFAGLYGIIATILFETPALPANGAQWWAVLGLALVCSAFGFVVQPVAQRYTTPEHTGLLFALEPVFSALFAFIFLHETLSIQGWLGAGFVLCGITAASRNR